MQIVLQSDMSKKSGKAKQKEKVPTPRRSSARVPAAAVATAIDGAASSTPTAVVIVNAEADTRTTPPSSKKARLFDKTPFEVAVTKKAMATVLTQGQLKQHLHEIEHPFLAYMGSKDEAAYWVLHAIVPVLNCAPPQDLEGFLRSSCPFSKKSTADSWRQHIITAAAGNQAKVSNLVRVIFQQLTALQMDEEHTLCMPDQHRNDHWKNWIEQLFSIPAELSVGLYYDPTGKLRSQPEALVVFGEAYDQRAKTDTMNLVLSGEHQTANLITLMETDEDGVLAVLSSFMVCCIYKNDISKYLALFAAGKRDFRKLSCACLFSCT